MPHKARATSSQASFDVKTYLQYTNHPQPNRGEMSYLVPAVIAEVGFFASVACHLMGWLQVEPPWGRSIFVLHVGIFVVWIPLVILANRTMPKPGRGNFEHLLSELPRWARGAIYALFIYALANFAYFILCTRQYPRHEVPFNVELRGFSGHWMMY